MSLHRSMQGRVIPLLLAVLTLLSVNVSAHPYDEYQRTFDNWGPIFDDIRTPGKPRSILFEVSAEVSRINTAESAIANIIIQANATSGNAALSLARERREKIKSLIRFLSDSTPEFEHDTEDVFYIQDDRIASFVPQNPHHMSIVDHSAPIYAAVKFKAAFTDLTALHWFVYSIKDEKNVRICLLPWGLTPQTHFLLHGEMREELMAELTQIGVEFADENALEIVSMQDYNDGFVVYNQYTRAPARDGGETVEYDFNSWDSIREFFAESPETTDCKAGSIRTVFRAQCKFRAVTQALDQKYKSAVKKQAEILRAEQLKERNWQDRMYDQ